MTVLIAPSILSANFGALRDETRRCEAAGADWIHFDVMDGDFVPNITFGARVVEAVRSASRLPFDVHLMINRPDRYLDAFLDAGADIVTIHVESPCDIRETLGRIRDAGRRAGITLRPGTPLERLDPFHEFVDLVLVMSVEPGFGGQAFLDGALERIRSLAAIRERSGRSFQIEVDGGINDQTGRRCVDAGADVLVAGNHLFRHRSLEEGIAGLRGLY